LLSGTTKKGHTTYKKNVPLSSALYNSLTNAVTLIPRSKLNTVLPMQLRITAALLTDLYGRPIDGDYDGQPGGDAVINLGKKSATILIATPMKAAPQTPAAAVDAVLGDMRDRARSALMRRR
jgi:hypothetical protein